jgi:hypothetical protein
VFAGAIVLASSIACDAPDAEIPPDTSERARAALGPFQSQLLGALTSALAESGPEGAIGACRTAAPELARAAGGEGISIGRTSRKLRNPANAPEPWMEPLLDAYAAGTTREPQVVRIDAKHVGYVEPIFVKPLCLTCHGDGVDDSIRARLAAEYPNDRATGYVVDDLRGIFWVKLTS